MYWEVFVDAGYSCNEVIFECLDGTFHQVSSVKVGRDELKAFVLLCHEFLQYLGALVAEIVHFRLKSALRE